MKAGKTRVKRGDWPRFLFPSLVSLCLFFPALEGALRICRYGYPAGYLRSLDIGGKPHSVVNPGFFRTYFPPALAPYAEPIAIPQAKDPGTYRIFVLGESAAAGIPDPAFGFSRMLERLLEARHPGIRFEVINLAVTAINSHLLLPMAKAAAREKPDLFLVYMGNNEFIGPYGPGTVFAPFAGSNAFIRPVNRLKETRTGQMLGDFLEWAGLPGMGAPGGKGAPGKWAGMEMFQSHAVAYEDERVAVVHGNFEENLADMLRAARNADAPLILSSIAVNRRDNPPFASMHRKAWPASDSLKWISLCDSAAALEARGDSASLKAALGLYLQAEALDEVHAGLFYRIGRLANAMGDRNRSDFGLSLAIDADALRFRAGTAVNMVLRSPYGFGRDALTRYVDADSVFRAAARDGEPGREYFYEHVHFRPEGNYLLARAFMPQIDSALILSGRFPGAASKPATDSLLSLAALKASLALTGWDELGMAEKILALIKRPPFVGNDGDTAQAKGAFAASMRAERIARIALMQAEVDSLKRYATPESLQSVLDLYQAAIRAHPADPVLRRNLGELFYATDYLPEAAEQYRAALEPLPHDTRTRQRLAKAMLEQGDVQGAIAEYRIALSFAPASVEIHNGLANALAGAGEHALAVAHYRRALEGGSVLPEVHFNLARTFIALGRTAEALAQLEAALREDPGFRPAGIELERLRAVSGNGSGAK